MDWSVLGAVLGIGGSILAVTLDQSGIVPPYVPDPPLVCHTVECAMYLDLARLADGR